MPPVATAPWGALQQRPGCARETHLLQKWAAELVNLPEIDELPFRRIQISDHYIFGNGQVGKQIQFLINNADSLCLRLYRVSNRDLFAVDENTARIRRDRARQNLRKRAFPAPFSPISACTSPASTETLAFFSA